MRLVAAGQGHRGGTDLVVIARLGIEAGQQHFMVGADGAGRFTEIERIGAGAEADQGVLGRIRAPAQNGTVVPHLLDIGAARDGLRLGHAGEQSGGDQRAKRKTA